MDNTNNCVRREIENCLIPSANQNEYFCAQCKQGYILDPANAKCVEVPSNKVVSNCRQYTLVGTCKHCFQNYYLEGNTCNRVGVIIENCRTYFGDDLCEECFDNYYFDVSTNKCVSFEPIENCDLHTFNVCEECQPGFYPNGNQVILATLDNDLAQRVATFLWEGVNYAKIWQSTCLPNTDPNCLEMETSISSGKLTNACKTCNTGYYLSSGKCVVNPGWVITNCTEYATPEICKQCSEEFYLDCNECKARGTYTDCLEKDWYHDHCFRCNETHYLNSSGVCTNRINGGIAGCSKYRRTLDECETCNTGFIRTNDFIDCFAEIDSCTTYKLPAIKADTKMFCETCSTNYYLMEDKTECNPQNVLNCQSYASSSSNVCSTCDSDYYLDAANNVCIKKNIDHCDVYESSGTTCQTCEQMYHRSSDKLTCTKVEIADCLENVTNQDNCALCVANRYLQNDGTRVICVAMDKRVDVQGCKASNNTDETLGCSVCENGDYAPFTMSNFIDKLPTGCLSYSFSSEKCDECQENYNATLLSTGHLGCTANPDLTSVCKHHRGEENTDLSDQFAYCSLCREYSTHFLLNSICWERNPVYNQNCLSFGNTTESCDVCKEGFSAKESDATDGPVCMSNPTGFTTMTGCAVYNIWDTSKCVKCEWGYSVSPQGLCVLSSSISSDKSLKNFFDISSRALGATSYTSRVYGKTTSSNADTVDDCQSGFLKHMGSKKYGYDYFNKGIFADTYSVSCVKDDSMAMKDDGSGGKVKYVTSDECDLAYKSISTHYCIKCKNNMNAKYTLAKYDKDGNDITSSGLSVVESCTPASDTVTLSKKYKGAGFRVDDNLVNKTFFDEELLYDTCPNEDHNLVIVLSNASGLSSLFKVESDLTTSEERAFCYDFGSSPVVNHCYLYGIEYQSSGYNYRSGTFECIACKPGYAPTLKSGSDGRFISACTLIPNCDVSDPAKNTWMNACETCATDHIYIQRLMQTNKNYLDISTCQSRTKTNCLVENTSSDCVLCDAGFVLDSGNCQAISPSVPNCSKNAYSPDQMADLNLDVTNDKYAYSFASYIQLKFESISAKSGCAECVSTFSLFGIREGGSSFRCESNTSIEAGGTVLTTNCKTFSGAEANKCLECVDTHILDQTDACVAKSTLDSTVYVDNCQVLDSASDPKECTTCQAGSFQNTTTKECIRIDKCTEYSMSSDLVQCDNCADGYMVDDRDKSLCIPIYIPHCTTFYNGLCRSCESGYFLVAGNYTSGNNAYYCAKNSFDDPMLNLGATLKAIVNSMNRTGINALRFDDIPTGYDTNDDTNKVFTNQLCVENLMEGCATSYDNYFCQTCSAGYWKHPTYEVCIPNTIDHCKVQESQNSDPSDLYVCVECDTGYFLNSIKQCQKQNVDDCEVYLSDEAGCQTCTNAHYLSNKKCYPHTVQNCTTYEDDANLCDVCNEFYYESNGQCVAHTVSGCREYHPNLDECDSCYDRYYLNGGQCKLNTGKDCKNYYSNSNGCSDCHNDSSTHVDSFIIDGLDCVAAIEIVGCTSYDYSGQNGQNCQTCESSYFNYNGVCEPYPTGVRFCEVFSSATSCVKCIPDYFLDVSTGQCSPIYRPIEHCVDYSSAVDCKECVSGYLLATDFKSCSLYTGSNCKTYATFDSCATCEPSMALKQTPYVSSDGVNKIMECSSEITHCEELVTSQSTSEINDTQGNVRTDIVYSFTCNKCSSGYLPSEDKSSCETTITIGNCQVYTDDGLCQSCNVGFWLSKDKKSCTQDSLLNGNGCKKALIGENIVCNRCTAGYMMDSSGNCVQCGGTGCAICDFESSSSCALCGPGYYMTSSKTCNRNENFSFNLDKEEISGGDPINRTSNSYISADEGRYEDDENFGMKLSALILGMVTLLIGLI
jgi:hypothetical protein